MDWKKITNIYRKKKENIINVIAILSLIREFGIRKGL